MMRMYRMFKKEEGFTLVELMVVVLIIGILVAIAIPVYNAASDSARQRTCQSNMRVIEGAVQQYVAANDGAVVADLAGKVNAGHELVPEFVKEVPYCPSDDAKTPYSLDASGTTACPIFATTDHEHF